MRQLLGKGVCDPHIRIFNNIAYLYASHDLSEDSKSFVMPDWWIWSSDDLVHWTHETTLQPEDTYIGTKSNGCWATDAIEKNGRYYWYFSDVRENIKQIGVMVSDSPTGPWKDVLGKPFLSHETWAHVYDPTLFQDVDGSYYILFGAFDYYIAKLSEDMLSLVEPPQRITVINPKGPYGRSTDDKVFLHKRMGYYYLSWGCFYAMSKSLYGPYEYKGSIISEEYVAEEFRSPTWPHGLRQGRHGSFFEWNNQWYFTYCDISQGKGNRYYRDSWISYVYYRTNGEIAPLEINSIGVGQQDAARGLIKAAQYFASEGTKIIEKQTNYFVVLIQENGATLTYPNIRNIPSATTLELELASVKHQQVSIEVSCLEEKQVLGIIDIDTSYQLNKKIITRMPLDHSSNTMSLGFHFWGTDIAGLTFLGFRFLES